MAFTTRSTPKDFTTHLQPHPFLLQDTQDGMAPRDLKQQLSSGTTKEGFGTGADQDKLEKGSHEASEAPTSSISHASPVLTFANDPINPRNWPTSKKVLVNVVLCIWVLSLTYSSTAYVASIPAIMQEYHIGREAAVLGVTLTVLGFAAGPLLAGPSSEMFGRRPVYILCGVLYSAFSFGAAFANNAASLLIFRFLLGFFGSASINNVPASIGDFTVPLNRATYSALYAICAFGGPASGPLCSAFIENRAGYQWNLRVIAIFSTVTSLAVAIVPETHGPTLIKQQQERMLTKHEREQNSKRDKKAKLRKILGVYGQSLKRPAIFLFTEPIVLFVSLYLAILYGILYGFFQAFGIVYLQTRRFTPEHYGLTYISLFIGFLLGGLLIVTVGAKAFARRLAQAEAEGKPIPAESRLTLAYGAAILSPISLILFAFTAPYNNVHWIVPCIAEFLFSFSMFAIYVSFIPYLIDVYSSHAASALAAGTAARALLGGVFPLFAIQMYERLTIQGATSLLAGLSLLCAPLPFIFRRKGARLRERSTYAAANGSI